MTCRYTTRRKSEPTVSHRVARARSCGRDPVDIVGIGLTLSAGECSLVAKFRVVHADEIEIADDAVDELSALPIMPGIDAAEIPVFVVGVVEVGRIGAEVDRGTSIATFDTDVGS